MAKPARRSRKTRRAGGAEIVQADVPRAVVLGIDFLLDRLEVTAEVQHVVVRETGLRIVGARIPAARAERGRTDQRLLFIVNSTRPISCPDFRSMSLTKFFRSLSGQMYSMLPVFLSSMNRFRIPCYQGRLVFPPLFPVAATTRASESPRNSANRSPPGCTARRAGAGVEAPQHLARIGVMRLQRAAQSVLRKRGSACGKTPYGSHGRRRLPSTSRPW
jgi:hypothetical protein